MLARPGSQFEAVRDLLVADAVVEHVPGDTAQTLALAVGLCAVIGYPHTVVVSCEVVPGLALDTDPREQVVLDAGGVVDQLAQAVGEFVALHAGDAQAVDHVETSVGDLGAGLVVQVVPLEALEAGVGRGRVVVAVGDGRVAHA